MPAFGIRFNCSHPIGAAIATELDRSHWLAIVYQRSGEDALWEGTRRYGTGIDAERACAGEARELNRRLKRWREASASGDRPRD